jgi:hypothetical protein
MVSVDTNKPSQLIVTTFIPKYKMLGMEVVKDSHLKEVVEWVVTTKPARISVLFATACLRGADRRLNY